MVELLQGTIEVKSEIDQYAQFIVNLPQLEVTEEAEHVLNETPKSEPLSNNTNIETAERGDYEKEFNQPETTILMIDDNKELLWMLKDILSDEYSILTAENGEEGLVFIKTKDTGSYHYRHYDAQNRWNHLNQTTQKQQTYNAYSINYPLCKKYNR